jgi:anti-anti-sigma regulatory factor
LVSSSDRCALIRVSGRANFSLSCDFKDLLQRLQERHFETIIVDLRDCLTMDSTFLGVLASAAIEFAAAEPGREVRHIRLLGPNPTVSDLITSLGIMHLFRLMEQTSPLEISGPAVPASHAEHTRAEVARTCLQAHEFLMSLNEANAAKFKDVARFLAEDVRRLEG